MKNNESTLRKNRTKKKLRCDVKGYGFLETPEDGDYFVHFMNIVDYGNGEGGFKTLTVGSKVSFKIAIDEDGREKAVQVTVIG